MPADAVFAFGLVADIQYACKVDSHTEGRCQRYGEVPVKLSDAVSSWQHNEPALKFVLSLGDLVDGRPTQTETDEDYTLITHMLKPVTFPAEFYHVFGNHCLAVPRHRLLKDLHMPHSYYSKSLPCSWRLLILDTTEISGHHRYPQESALAQEAAAYKVQHPLTEQEPHMADWNGGIGMQQISWLEQQLQAAAEAQERVVVACHHPLGQGAARATHMAWNCRDIEALLLRSPWVRLVLSGHDHMGGYVKRQHIHFVTLEAMLEAPAGSNAYAVVEVKPTQIQIHGQGAVTSRVLHV